MPDHDPPVDCVLLFRWGVRPNGELGPANDRLLRLCLDTYGVMPVIASQELGPSYASLAESEGRRVELVEVSRRGPNRRIARPADGTLLVLAVTQPWSGARHWWQRLAPGRDERDGDSARHDTREFLGQCKRLMDALGARKAGVVAMPVQLERIGFAAEQLGIEIAVPDALNDSNLDIPYDGESKEPWTRSHVAAVAYERATLEMYRAADWSPLAADPARNIPQPPEGQDL